MAGWYALHMAAENLNSEAKRDRRDQRHRIACRHVAGSKARNAFGVLRLDAAVARPRQASHAPQDPATVASVVAPSSSVTIQRGTLKLEGQREDQKHKCRREKKR